MVQKYKRILVPYDDSKYSQKALDEAIEIAKKFDSDLTLLSVIDTVSVAPQNLYKTGAVIGAKKLTKYLKKAFSKIDLKLRDKVIHCKESDVNADYEIVTGSPANVILQFAKKRNIDLIVMGSQGLVGISKIKALGSVSRKVSEKAPCPVLIIR